MAKLSATISPKEPRQPAVRKTLKAGVLYFSLTFTTGFLLGIIRTLWVVPCVGVRIAELMEAPIMFVAIILAARWVVRCLSFPPTLTQLLRVGLIGLGLLLVAELTVVFWLRHLTITEYLASRDPVAGTVYLLMLTVFALMPLFVAQHRDEKRVEIPDLLDPFIAMPDVRERRQVIIRAPTSIVFDVACDLDMNSISAIRTIFWLRAKAMGAAGRRTKQKAGLIAEMLNIGWGCLAEVSNQFFVGGAVCQPSQADVVFSAIKPERFASFAEPDCVKIAWTLETEALGPALTRFATETRAVATDDEARVKFRRYWRTFGIGVVLIRCLLLSTVRRQAEQRWERITRLGRQGVAQGSR
jgi:hypothetical protein